MAMSPTQRMMTILVLSVLSICSLVNLINDDKRGISHSDSDSMNFISSSGGVYRQLLNKNSKAEREERRKRRAMKMKKIQKDGMKGKEVVHCDDVTSEMVAKSRVYGNPGRWQKVLHKMMNKEKVKIAVLGGSVTAGAECLSPKHYWSNLNCAWPSRLQTLLTSYDPNWNVEFVNMAKGGTPSVRRAFLLLFPLSIYIIVCAQRHITLLFPIYLSYQRAGLALVLGLVDYDAIIINWTANDDKIDAHYKKGGAKEMKEVFETLVRSALALPKNPALILFEDYGRRMFDPEPIAEEIHHAIAR